MITMDDWGHERVAIRIGRVTMEIPEQNLLELRGECDQRGLTWIVVLAVDEVVVVPKKRRARQ